MTRNEFFEEHKSLAYKIAKEIRAKRPSFDGEAIVQGALMGLWNATERFNPDQGVKFSTYAYKTIWGEAYREGAESSQFGRYWPWRFATGKAQRPTLVSAKEDMVPYKDHGPQTVDNQDEFEAMLKRIPGEKNRQVVRAWAEIEDMAEVGRRFGLSRQRVRQIVTKALKRLRRAHATPA